MAAMPDKFRGFFAGRRCAVTGAGGFIGSALCQRLRDRGADVYALGRGPPVHRSPEQWLGCDVTDLSQVKAALDQCRPQIIFHLASKVSGSQDIALILPTLQVNLLGLIHVALTAAELKCERIISMGSLTEPDQGISGVPHSPYAAAKFAASCYARMFSAIYGVPITLAKPMMVYGPGQMDFTKLIPYVASQLLSGRTAQLSSGKQQFDWVYVGDVVDALMLIAATPDLEGRMLEIGTGVLTSVADIATGLAARLGVEHLLKLGVIADRRSEPTRFADTVATSELLGWRASVGVEKGLDATAAWFLHHQSGAGA